VERRGSVGEGGCVSGWGFWVVCGEDRGNEKGIMVLVRGR